MIRHAIQSVVLNGLALYGLVYLLNDVNYRGGLAFFIIGALVIGALNAVVKPILKAATFPFIFFSAGLFLIIINTAILWLTREIIDIIHYKDVVFQIEGIVTFLIAGFLIGIINWLE